MTACSIDGQLVAMPWTKKKSSKAILLYRKDLADQYGVDTSRLETVSYTHLDVYKRQQEC